MVQLNLALFNFEEALAIFDRLPIFDQSFDDGSLKLRLNLVHDFHRLDDADDGVLDDFGACVGEGLTFREAAR